MSFHCTGSRKDRLNQPLNESLERKVRKRKREREKKKKNLEASCSKRGPLTSGINIFWELMRNASSQTSTRICGKRDLQLTFLSDSYS